MTLEQALARIAELEAENKELRQAEYFGLSDDDEWGAHTWGEVAFQCDVCDREAINIMGSRTVYDKWVIRIPISIDDDGSDFEANWAEFDTEEQAQEAYTKARLNLENGRGAYD